jgi:hypothetical protein
MECAFGLKGKDYAIVACDGHVDFSIINFKKDEDKIRIVWYHSYKTSNFRLGGRKQIVCNSRTSG